MSKLLLHFDIRVMYNQFKENETDTYYDVSEFVDSSYTLNEAIDYVFNLYNIKLDDEQKKHRYINIMFYLFNDFNFGFVEFDWDKAMNTKVSVLEEYFNISKRVLTIHYVDGIGEALDEVEGIKFIFHSNEKDIHHVPHIHCRYSGEEFRINLNTLELIDNPFKSKKKTKLAIEYVSKNKDELLRVWNLFVIKGLPFDYIGSI